MSNKIYFFGENNFTEYNEGIANEIRNRLTQKLDRSVFDSFTGSIYTKSQCDSLFAPISVVTTLEEKATVTGANKDVYTMSEIDTLLLRYVQISGSDTAATQAWVIEQLGPYINETRLTSALSDYVLGSELTSILNTNYYTKTEVDEKITDALNEWAAEDYYNKSEVDSMLETKFSLAEGEALKVRVTTLEDLVNNLSIGSGAGSSSSTSSLGASLDLNNIWNWANIPTGNFEFHTGEALAENPKTTRYGRDFKTAQMYQKKSTVFDLTNYSIKIGGTILVTENNETTTKTLADRERDFVGVDTTIFRFCNNNLKAFLDIPFNIGSGGLKYNSQSVMSYDDWNEFIETYYIESESDDFNDLIIKDSKILNGSLTISVCPFAMVGTETPYDYIKFKGSFASAPAESSVGDCYYDTTDSKVKLLVKTGADPSETGWGIIGDKMPYGSFAYKGSKESISALVTVEMGDCYFFEDSSDVKVYVKSLSDEEYFWGGLDYSAAPSLMETGQFKIQWKKRIGGGSNILKLVLTSAPTGTSENINYLNEIWQIVSYYQNKWNNAKADLGTMDNDNFISLSLEKVGSIYEILFWDASGVRNEFMGKADFLKLLAHIRDAYDRSDADWTSTKLYFNDVQIETYDQLGAGANEITTLINSLGYSSEPGVNMDTTDISDSHLQSIKSRYQKDTFSGYEKVFQKQSDIFESSTGDSTVTSLGGVTGDILLDQDVEEPGNVRMWVDEDEETGEKTLRGWVNPTDPQTVVQPGMIMMWPGSTFEKSDEHPDGIPAGYLLCNGQSVTVEQYASLYSVIGDKFTDIPSGTAFNVPNMEGMMRFVHYIIKI